MHAERLRSRLGAADRRDNAARGTRGTRGKCESGGTIGAGAFDREIWAAFRFPA